MNRSTASRQGSPGSLARLDEVIAELEEQLVRYRAARAVLLELDGIPTVPAAIGGKTPPTTTGRLTPPARPASALSDYNRQKSENARAANRLAIARLMLAEGPLGFNAIYKRFPGRSGAWITRTVRGCPWFEKVGPPPAGSVDSRPWGLSDAGRAEAAALLAAEQKPARRPAKPAATKSRPKPRDPKPAAEPPADPGHSPAGPADLRANPTLDAEFEDLFMPEARGGKPVPRPSLNGSGRGHHPPVTLNGRH